MKHRMVTAAILSMAAMLGASGMIGCSSPETGGSGSQGAGGTSSGTASGGGGASSSSGPSSSSVSSSSASSTGPGGPQNPPAWLVACSLNEWCEIADTAGAGGVNVDAYSGMALADSNSEIVIAAAGGHHDGFDNSVVSLVLASDSPKWVTRKASSTNTPEDVAYYPDGLPSARHLYQSIHVIESLHRVFLFGARYTWGNAFAFPTVDAFDLTTNEWDPAGTWADVPNGGAYGVVRVRATDDVYTSTFFKWTAQTQSWSQPITTRTNDLVRFPVAHDSLRNQLFTLQLGDGQGYDGPTIYASKVPLSGSAQISVTINNSPAYAQFQADAPTYSAMDYDPDGDRFLFYCGQGAGAGRVYVITPNDSNQWDMSILTLGPGSATPPAVPGSGVNSRFRYVPGLKGFVLLPNKTSNIFFLRTA